MKNKLNVIWIMVDAVRNYHSTGDELARLPIIDKLAKEGVDFSQAVASATSTAMSISSQMAGVPGYYLSRNFVDFKYEPENFTTLSRILRENGYNNYGISFAIDLRYRFHGIVDHVPKKYWPKGYPLVKAWDNKGVIKLFNNILKKGLKEPSFLFIHINGRRDYEVNGKIEYMLKKLDNHLTKSIIIINSDHGMPDPSKKGFYEIILADNLFFHRHDLVMTDDNILMPLVIKYPNCKKNKISTAVGAIDIVPTILDLVNIKIKSSYNIIGKSLVQLINGRNIEFYKKRKIRTDTRYLTQKDRIVSLRNSRYKYIYYKDISIDKKELFFDLLKDKKEKKNLINSKNPIYINLIKEFRKEYQSQESEAMNFQINYLYRKFSKIIEKNLKKLKTTREIFVIGSNDPSFDFIMYKILKRTFNKSRINFFVDSNTYNSEVIKNVKGQFICYNKLNKNILEKKYVHKRRADLLLISADKVKSKSHKEMINLEKLIKPKYKFFFDYNLNVTRNLALNNFLKLVKKAIDKREYYLKEPKEFFYDIYKFITGNVGVKIRLLRFKNKIDKTDYDVLKH